MSDVAQKAAEARLKVTALSEEITVLEREATSLEAEARARRARREAAKKERGEWQQALDSLGVQQAVETAQQAATKAKAEADADRKQAAAVLAEVEKMKADLAAKLAEKKPE